MLRSRMEMCLSQIFYGDSTDSQEEIMYKDRWVKAAFATGNGKQVNAGFEQTNQIAVYEISPITTQEFDTITYRPAPAVGAVSVPKGKCGEGCGDGKKQAGGCGGGKKVDAPINEREITEKVESLNGVSVLFVSKSLHAFSALALNRARIFTIKLDSPEDIGVVTLRLQEMLRSDPPLWLRRVMRGADAEIPTEADVIHPAAGNQYV
jgi:nitrogen fixation protein NifX